MLTSIIAVCGGACAGALLRWGINSALNSFFPALPPGTLVANLAGALLMGIAMGCFAHFPELGTEWRLAVITGFLGSLTTFSAFSGEMAQLIIGGRFALCALGIFLHVAGSITMVFLGMGLFGMAKKFTQI